MKDWSETFALGLLVLLLAAAHLLPDAPEDGRPQPLFAAAPGALSITWDNQAYSLRLDQQPPLLADAAYHPLGRLAPASAASIQEALRATRIVRRLRINPRDPAQRAAYGLDQALQLHSPDQGGLWLSTAADGRSYAWHHAPERIWQLDRDLAGLLRRHPAALRDGRLLGAEPIVLRSPAGQLERIDQRWWFRPAENEELLWLDQPGVETWLQGLEATPAHSYLSVGSGTVRARLHCQVRDVRGRLQDIDLLDRGPRPGGGRLIERRSTLAEQPLREFLVIASQTPLDPDPQTWRPPHLLPLAQDTVTSWEWPGVQVQRTAEGWQINQQPDVNATALDELLSTLHALPADAHWPRRQPPQTPALLCQAGALRCGLAEAPLPLPPAWRLRNRHLLLNAEADVTALVVSPRSGAPRVHERGSDGHWPEQHAEIEAFLTALHTARVRVWQGPHDADRPWTSTLTLAYGPTRQVRITLDDSGLVGHIERNLCGPLTDASRTALIGE